MTTFVVIPAVLQVLMVVTAHFNEFVLLNLSAVWQWAGSWASTCSRG
jgi:hypothetical protein